VTLHQLRDHLEVIWGAALAFVIVILLTPAVAGMARRLGAVDVPDERRVHRIPIPRLGGLALFFGIMVPSLAFLDLSRPVRGLLLGRRWPPRWVRSTTSVACAGGRSSAARSSPRRSP
jgi:UDP-N-acetylmuramyl pentapeptide phosphotransferase/UDP-N-acetylglucosamine-1-phosphate transferase